MRIRKVHVFDGQKLCEGLFDVVTEQNRIAAVTPWDGTPAAQGEIDGNGGYLLPGLIDLHVHLTWDGLVDPAMDIWHRSKEENLLETVANTLKYLQAGVTSVRDLGSPDDDCIHVGQAIRRGWLAGPRIFGSGQSIIMTGGHDPFHGIPVDGPWEALKAVRTQVMKGCAVIKVSATGGVYGREEGEAVDDTELRKEELEMIMDEAHRRHVPVTAHAIGEQGIRACLEAGIDCIEHGQYIQEDMAQFMAQHGVAFVPTFYIYKHLTEDPNTPEYAREKASRVLEHHKNAVRLAKQYGVTIGTGSDAGSPNTPHPALQEELEALTESGLTNTEILAAATGNAAKILWQEGKVGTVAPGAFADLLLVDADPTADLTVLRKLRMVIANGEIAADNR